MKALILFMALGFASASCAHDSNSEQQSAQNTNLQQESLPMPKNRRPRMGADRMKPGPRQFKMSADMHEKMAEMHRQVAECIKAGKAESECMELLRTEHRKICQAANQENCIMMGRMMSRGYGRYTPGEETKD